MGEIKLNVHPCWVGDEALMGELLKDMMDKQLGAGRWKFLDAKVSDGVITVTYEQ